MYDPSIVENYSQKKIDKQIALKFGRYTWFLLDNLYIDFFFIQFFPKH